MPQPTSFGASATCSRASGYLCRDPRCLCQRTSPRFSAELLHSSATTFFVFFPTAAGAGGVASHFLLTCVSRDHADMLCFRQGQNMTASTVAYVFWAVTGRLRHTTGTEHLIHILKVVSAGEVKRREVHDSRVLLPDFV